LPSGAYLEGEKGGEYEDLDGQWNKVGWGLWGLWNRGGTVYNVASLDGIENISVHPPPPRLPPPPRWTFDKFVAQGPVDGEVRLDEERSDSISNLTPTCTTNELLLVASLLAPLFASLFASLFAGRGNPNCDERTQHMRGKCANHRLREW